MAITKVLNSPAVGRMESANQFKGPGKTNFRPTKYPVSITQLAARTGLRRGHISKILNGRRARIDTVALIAEAMGVSLDYFYRSYCVKAA